MDDRSQLWRALFLLLAGGFLGYTAERLTGLTPEDVMRIVEQRSPWSADRPAYTLRLTQTEEAAREIKTQLTQTTRAVDLLGLKIDNLAAAQAAAAAQAQVRTGGSRD